MHRAALALTATVCPTEQLGHHRADRHALGDAVPVTAVGGGDVVAVVQVRAYANGHRLLARVQVHEPGDAAVSEELGHPFLERADGYHPVVDPRGLVPGELHQPPP